VVAMGLPALVIDSHDVRDAPEAMLRTLCEGLGLAFDPAMLSWPAGGHADDGVWAAHWYDAVHRSTGFAGPEGPLPDLPSELAEIFAQALEPYERLKAYALRPQEA
jgi:hypothetical protein